MRTALGPLTVLLLGLACWNVDARAQDPGPVAPDRPGFGDGAAVVPYQYLQIEAGYAFSDADAVNRHSIGQMVVRVGMARGVELRMLLNSYVVQRNGTDVDGFEDVAFGAKVNLLEGTGTPLGVPTVTAIASVALPTGADALTNDEVTPEARLALDLGLTEAVAFSANAGYTFTPDDDRADTFFTYAALSAAVPGTRGLGAFAGLFSLFPGEGDASHGVDGGLTFLPDPSTQFDVNVGVGLTDAQPDLVVGAGVVRRF